MPEEENNTEGQIKNDASFMSENEFEELEDNIKSLQKRLRFRHKVIYALLGFIGVVMAWRGFWRLLNEIPLLENSIVCLVAGISILLVTGAFFKEL